MFCIKYVMAEKAAMPTLVLDDDGISRVHARVYQSNGVHYIEDLGSANGVWKDGVKIQKEKIRDGDEFMISEEVLKFIYR